jgi:hypothetical protein
MLAVSLAYFLPFCYRPIRSRVAKIRLLKFSNEICVVAHDLDADSSQSLQNKTVDAPQVKGFK